MYTKIQIVFDAAEPEKLAEFWRWRWTMSSSRRRRAS